MVSAAVYEQQVSSGSKDKAIYISSDSESELGCEADNNVLSVGALNPLIDKGNTRQPNSPSTASTISTTPNTPRVMSLGLEKNDDLNGAMQHSYRASLAMEQFSDSRAQAAKSEEKVMKLVEDDYERRIQQVEDDCERRIQEVEEVCERRIQEVEDKNEKQCQEDRRQFQRICNLFDSLVEKLVPGNQDAGCHAIESRTGNLPSLTFQSQDYATKRGAVAISDANVGDFRNDHSVDHSVDSWTKAGGADSTAGSEYDADNEARPDNSDAPTDDISDDNVNKHRGEADGASKKRKIGL